MPTFRTRAVEVAMGISLSLGGTTAVAQESTPSSPEELARAFFAAMDEERWSDAADLYDPDSLESWGRRVVREMESRRENFEEMMRRADPETVRRSNPALSDAAADSAARAMEEQLDFGWRMTLSNRFAGIESLEALRAVDARDLAARALEAASPAYRKKHALDAMVDRRRMGGRNEVDDEERARMRAELERGTPLERVREIEGTVLAGDRAYVVYRIRFVAEDDLGGPDTPALLPLIRTDAGWRLVQRGENLLEEPGPFRVTRQPAPPD